MPEYIKDYKIIKFLGRGKSANSFLVEKNNCLYVYKQMTDEHDDTDKAQKINNELVAYDFLKQSPLNVPKIIESNRTEHYLIKEYINGPTLAEQISKGVFDIDAYLTLFAQAMHLEDQGINIDYFPTNFVIKGNDIFYIDYEINPYSDEWNFANWGSLFLFHQKGFLTYLKDFRDTSELLNADEKPLTEPINERHKAFFEILELIHLHEIIRLLKKHHKKAMVRRIQMVTSGIAARSFRIDTTAQSYLYKVYTDVSKRDMIHSEIKAYQHQLDMMPKLLGHGKNNKDIWLLFEYIEGQHTMALYSKHQNNHYIQVFADVLKKIHSNHHHEMKTSDFIKEELHQIETINQSLKDEKITTLVKHLYAEVKHLTQYPLSRIHGDFHPWNTLHHNDKIYVVDWQYRFGDYRYDLFWAYSLLLRSGYEMFARKFLEYYALEAQIPDRNFFLALTNVRWFVNVKVSLMKEQNSALSQMALPQILKLNELISTFINLELAF